MERWWLCLCLCLFPVTADVRVTKSLIEGEIEDIFWSSDRAAHLYTDKGFAYLSTDQGQSFSPFAECPHEGCVEEIKPLPEAFRHLTLYHGMDKSWVVASNGSVVQTIPHDLTHIIHHPVRLQRLLAVACSSPLFNSQHCDLFVSYNGGQTLDLIQQDIWPAASLGWAVPQAEGFDEDLVFFVRMTEFQVFELVRYHLKTKQSEVQVVGCAAYAQKYEFMFAAKLQLGLNAELQVSRDNGHSWQPVKLPNEDPQLRFTIVDASEHMMFVNIYHQEGSTWGSTYSSDSSGQWFTDSLRYNRRNHKGQVDFHRVHGLDGAFIANVVARFGQNLQCQMCRDEDQCDEACEYQSRLSLDKGHSWQPLAVPPDDPICGGTTTEDCSLHVHAEASTDERHGNIKSHDVSPGFLLSTGNTGRKLAIGEDAVDLFMSRDGGLSWKRIRRGRWLFAFSDHGGLIVIAAHDLTSVVLYSLDEGESWRSVNFTSDREGPVVVKKIVYNPYHPTSREMVLDTVTAQQEARVYRLDFSDVGVRACQGLSNPSDPASDYEWWAPKAHGETCFMGRVKKYALRKQRTICWDEAGTVRTADVSNCTCTWDDYECDYGYVETPDADGTPLCKPDPKVDVREEQCKDGRLRVTQGYVKTADNWCSGGLELEAYYVPCKPSPGSRAASSTSALLHSVGWGLLWGLLTLVCCLFLPQLRRTLDGFVHPLTRWERGYRRAGQDEDEDFDLEDDPHLVEDVADQRELDDLEFHTAAAADGGEPPIAFHAASPAVPTPARPSPVAPPSPPAPASPPAPPPPTIGEVVTSPRSPTSPTADEPLMKRETAFAARAPVLSEASDEEEDML